MAACRRKRNHVDPEDILHAAARYGAAMFFGKGIQFVGKLRRRCPGVNCFFASGDDVDPALNAPFHALVDVPDKTEQRDYCNIGIAFVKHFVGVVADKHARFYSERGKIADVHTDNFGVYVDCADNFRSLFVQIAKDISRHFSASVLNYSDLFHNAPLKKYFDTPCIIDIIADFYK